MNLSIYSRLATRSVSFVAVSALLSGCVGDVAPETDDTPLVTRADFEQAEDKQPQELAIVDHDDGSWSYALPASFDERVLVQGKLVTWRYDGQQRYSRDPQPVTGIRHHVVQPPSPRAEAERFKRLTRVDALGRRWKVARIDRAEWKRANAAGYEELAEQPQASTRKVPMDPVSPPGTVIEWQPTSWSHLNCTGGTGTKEVHLWEGESRQRVSSSYSSRERTAVMIHNTVTGGRCSGVILSPHGVLTAAHCVSDNNDNPVPVAQIKVTRAYDNQSRGLTDIDFIDKYTGGSGTGGGTDFADDWAILETNGAWTNMRDMDLSKAGDTTLGNLTRVHNLAFPGYAQYCSGAGAVQLFINRENQPIAGITSNKLKLKIDTSFGHSGSPLYYCPSGDDSICSGSEKAYVIGVMAGWNATSKRAVGPKAADFRSEAVVFLND